jgi:uncharacterized cupredoxin-like copper-binding protein
MPRSLVGAALAAAVALIAVACGGGGGASPTAAGATVVTADLKEFSITLDTTTVPAGDVDFVISNTGTIEHEFVVVATDTPAADLPVEGARVSEDDLEVVEELEEIAVGATPTLSVDGLAAGHYAIICNIDGHYQAGMRTDLTVQ